jgi:hypothetical protein
MGISSFFPDTFPGKSPLAALSFSAVQQQREKKGSFLPRRRRPKLSSFERDLINVQMRLGKNFAGTQSVKKLLCLPRER